MAPGENWVLLSIPSEGRKGGRIPLEEVGVMQEKCREIGPQLPKGKCIERKSRALLKRGKSSRRILFEREGPLA